MCMGGKQAILNLRKGENPIKEVAQTLDMANTNVKCPEIKEEKN